MKKVAFIVENGFLENHFGVRNYFSTLKQAMTDLGIQTEYLLHGHSETGILWYKINLEELVIDLEDVYIEDMPCNFNYTRIDEFIRKKNVNKGKKRQYIRCIGNSLEYEHYDIAIITNPWTVDAHLPICADRIVGIVHDFVANIYTLTKDEIGFDWGFYHQRGYNYYNQHCDLIMAVSEEIANQYREFYPNVDRKRINYFKPFVPYDISTGAFSKKDTKENAILLAAPFDLRKGLKDMPQILNSVSNEVDVLYIFGMPRCSADDLNEFFTNIQVKRVKYYPALSSSGLIDLYKKCKWLLFPSLEEGLGLPIVEAQICGCRVIVRDRAPMNQLALPGSVIFPDNIDIRELGEKITEGLKSDNFAYIALSMDARKQYWYDDIENFASQRGRFAI